MRHTDISDEEKTQRLLDISEFLLLSLFRARSLFCVPSRHRRHPQRSFRRSQITSPPPLCCSLGNILRIPKPCNLITEVQSFDLDPTIAVHFLQVSL